MTPIQANAVNCLLRHVLDLPDSWGHQVTHSEARAAASLLARAARHTTYDGITEQELIGHWPDPPRPRPLKADPPRARPLKAVPPVVDVVKRI